MFDEGWACLAPGADDDVGQARDYFRAHRGRQHRQRPVLREKLVNHVVFYLAPTLMGGQDAKAVIGDRSPKRLAQALTLRNLTVRRIGKDLVVEGDL